MGVVTITELLGLDEYEACRSEIQNELMLLRQTLRLSLGSIMSLAFENRRTVWYQIQEMLRAERITEPERIQDELDAYNSLIPAQGEFVATLFIEITNQEQIKSRLSELAGVEDSIGLAVGNSFTVSALGEDGRTSNGRTSSVHYLRFYLAPRVREEFQNLSSPVTVFVDHPRYKVQSEIPLSMREELKGLLAV